MSPEIMFNLGPQIPELDKKSLPEVFAEMLSAQVGAMAMGLGAIKDQDKRTEAIITIVKGLVTIDAIMKMDAEQAAD